MLRITGHIVYPIIAPKPKAMTPHSGGRVVGSHRPWTPREDQMVRDHYPSHETTEVAAMTGRTVKAVGRRAIDLGVYKSPECVKRIRGRAFKAVA